MKQGIYTGDRVKVYFPGSIVKGKVIGVADAKVTDAAGKTSMTTIAYLVECDIHVDEDRLYIITAPFLARDRSRP